MQACPSKSILYLNDQSWTICPESEPVLRKLFSYLRKFWAWTLKPDATLYIVSHFLRRLLLSKYDLWAFYSPLEMFPKYLHDKQVIRIINVRTYPCGKSHEHSVFQCLLLIFFFCSVFSSKGAGCRAFVLAIPTLPHRSRYSDSRRQVSGALSGNEGHGSQRLNKSFRLKGRLEERVGRYGARRERVTLECTK